MDNKTIIFDEELYNKNIKENSFERTGELEGLSEEDIKKLKEDGLFE